MKNQPKVFGLGVMKTGTSTLGRIFNDLGYEHRSFYPKLIRQIHRGEYDDLWDVADRYDTFEDYPWPLVYRELDERYPDAKFILTVRRDTETWYRSMAEHAKRMGPTAERKIIYGYGMPQWNPQAHRDHYEQHNEAVRAHFADRPDKFLDVCWETGSTRQDVARFLGQEVDEERKTPRSNAASSQSISPRFWARNLTKFVVIGKLKIDPFRHRDFTA